MVIDCKSHKFEVPTRNVMNPGDIQKWEQSNAYQDILGFLTSLNTAVKGKALSAECKVSPVTSGLVTMLDTLSGWVDDLPPVDQPQRYGNKAFRDFYARMKERGEDVVREALPPEYHAAVPEITVYLVEGVGNSTRIDYGTGHELAFIMFLACVFKIGALTEEDSVAVVTRVFDRYIKFCRQLQMIYKMEPAGSQGVWSLDDYQFVPFIWGSSQLCMHPKIAPEMFCQESIVEKYADDNLFLGCIKFILSVKTGPFAEHSNQLWNISGVQSWSKINQGLIKMYKAEVLHKFPVVQHVLFGSLLSFSVASDVVYHPPGGDQPLGRPVGKSLGPLARPNLGTFPVPVGGVMGSMVKGHNISPMGPGTMPIGVTKMPMGPGTMPIGVTKIPMGPGTMPIGVTAMPVGSTNMPPPMSINMPYSRMPVGSGLQSPGSEKINMPCTEERHPAMSPLDPGTPGNFHTQNV